MFSDGQYMYMYHKFKFRYDLTENINTVHMDIGSMLGDGTCMVLHIIMYGVDNLYFN